MSRYRQLPGDAYGYLPTLETLARVYRYLPPKHRLVFDALMDPPPHETERELAAIIGVPYRTFKLRKAIIMSLVRENIV